MKQLNKLIVIWCAILFAAAALAGCSAGGGNSGGGDPSGVPAQFRSLYQAAEKEGSFTLYTQLVPTTLQSLANHWASMFPGVKMNFVRLTTAPLEQRVQAELSSGAPDADVVMVSDAVWPDDLKQKGDVARYDIPAYSQWPAQYKSQGYYFVDQLYLSSVMYNTQEVSSAAAPTTYQDVLKYGKQASIVDPRAGGGNASIMYGTMQSIGPSFWSDAKKAGLEFDQSLADAEPKVVSGDLKAAINTNSLAACDQAAGKPIKVVYPKQGVYPTPAYTFGLAHAKHPKAAELFMTYLMSADGQQYINSRDCTYSVRPGVTQNSVLPRLDTLNIVNITPADWRAKGNTYKQQAASAAGMPIN